MFFDSPSKTCALTLSNFFARFAGLKCRSTKGEGPTACSAEGAAVHTCVYGLYKDIASKAAAAKEFSTYARCLNWYDLAVAPCKEEQKAFEAAYYKS